MDDEADVRAVDAHAEGHDGPTMSARSSRERLLVCRANPVGKTRVIRQGLMTFAAQPLRERLDLASNAYTMPDSTFVPGEDRLELLVQLTAPQDAVREVRAVE
jgi:hypothetical protein